MSPRALMPDAEVEAASGTSMVLKLNAVPEPVSARSRSGSRADGEGAWILSTPQPTTNAAESMMLLRTSGRIVPSLGTKPKLMARGRVEAGLHLTTVSYTHLRAHETRH